MVTSSASSQRIPLIKLKTIRSPLYEQLGRRPKSHFTRNYTLYNNITPKLHCARKVEEKQRRAKIRAAGPLSPLHPRMTLGELI